MKKVVISGTGLYSPEESVSNQELVTAFNQYVENYNRKHLEEIKQGKLEALEQSSEEFILKASGIKSRYVVNKSGILDPEYMHPLLEEKKDEEASIQCEMSVKAAKQAMEAAKKKPEEIDAVITACSNLQRPYPAIAVEIQNALNIDGFAFDMNVACSSATFGLQTATDSLRNGSTRCVLMVNPEICSAHLNFENRDCHFIFGDSCTAAIIETIDECHVKEPFRILGTRLQTKFSNNIRNNFGFLNRTSPETVNNSDKLFTQQGRKVFKEVVPLVAKLITEHLQNLGISTDRIKRLWLHQANLSMNQLISKKVLGREPEDGEAPVILDEYANTSSAGSMIAFHKYNEDFETGDIGTICSFGAGYSIGNVVVEKITR